MHANIVRTDKTVANAIICTHDAPAECSVRNGYNNWVICMLCVLAIVAKDLMDLNN